MCCRRTETETEFTDRESVEKVASFAMERTTRNNFDSIFVLAELISSAVYYLRARRRLSCICAPSQQRRRQAGRSFQAVAAAVAPGWQA